MFQRKIHKVFESEIEGQFNKSINALTFYESVYEHGLLMVLPTSKGRFTLPHFLARFSVVFFRNSITLLLAPSRCIVFTRLKCSRHIYPRSISASRFLCSLVFHITYSFNRSLLNLYCGNIWNRIRLPISRCALVTSMVNTNK